MQPGRTPNWNIVGDLEPSAWLEAVRPASDDRLLLPVSLRKRVDWAVTTASLPLLASIDPAGEVTVLPLSKVSGRLAAIRLALNNAKGDERSKLSFAAMATHSQIALLPDGRLRLSPTLALHLDTGSNAPVWVGAYSNIIKLWPDKVWKGILGRTSGSLRDAMTAAEPS